MYAVDEITWEVLKGAKDVLDLVRSRMSGAEYAEDKQALKEYLCNYFNTGTCTHKQGQKQICPMKSSLTAAGGKCLKVRWAIPGSGKSGGLRLAVVAYCDAKRVKIAGAWIRIDDPGNAEFEQATRGA